jgi:hypothetical protein
MDRGTDSSGVFMERHEDPRFKFIMPERASD